MNLLDMMVKFTVDTGEFEANVKAASDTAKGFGEDATGAGGKVEKLGPLTVAAGQLIVDAIEKAGRAVYNFAKSAADAAIEYETSMAQVSTIMDTTQVSTEDMSGAIKGLSSEMGIAASDIAESVYNVISATGDTANAVSMVETATKLAKGGFADTASATSVLTTAINAYGLEMEDAERISDSLIMVQNLGVTTVGELSTQMGKAIATGASYGVNLSNLETGYIALTKAGIGTAESTTYLSSMINELGDGGSEVASILKEKTKKSFGELMADGYSLSDVLGILAESVDNDSEKLANLWGSAEAGKASAAIAGQGLEEFNGWLKEVENSAGATQTAYETMANTTAEKIAKLKTSVQNLSTDAIAPLVDKVSEFLPKIQEYIDNIDLDTIKQNLTEMVPIMEGVAVVVGVITAGITAYNIVQAVKLAMEAAEVTTLGGLIAAEYAAATATMAAVAPFILVAAAIAAVVAIGILLYKNWDKVKAKAGELSGAVKQKFGEIKTNVTNAVNEAKETVDRKFEDIKTGVTNKINGARDAVKNAIEAIKGFMKFEWSLPHLKIPHFSISGGFSLNPPSMPKISVDWYAKAMDNPMMFTTPTVLQTAGGMKGFGDAGAEVVIGRDTMLNMISDAQDRSNSRMVYLLDRINRGLEKILVAVKEGKYIMLDDGTIVGRVNDRLGKIAAAEGMGW